MAEDLTDRVAIVTGSSRGIGRVCALTLARAGCDVVITAKTVEPTPRLPGTIHTVADEVEEETDRRALPVQCDVRYAEQVDEVVQATLEEFGRVDILVNNAGALWWKSVLDTPPKRFDLVMDVNVRGSFLFARACLSHMLEAGWGHIVNMSPPIDLDALPNRVAYLISKYGMTMLTRGLAEEHRGEGVAVNSLWPATIIESQATKNFGLGDRSMWREPDIVADALEVIVSGDPDDRSGEALIDEDILREAGVEDFDQYACVPGSEPMRLAWDAVPETG